MTKQRLVDLSCLIKKSMRDVEVRLFNLRPNDFRRQRVRICDFLIHRRDAKSAEVWLFVGVHRFRVHRFSLWTSEPVNGYSYFLQSKKTPDPPLRVATMVVQSAILCLKRVLQNSFPLLWKKTRLETLFYFVRQDLQDLTDFFSVSWGQLRNPNPPWRKRPVWLGRDTCTAGGTHVSSRP